MPAVLFQTDPESDPDLRTELPIDRATPFGVETVGQEVAKTYGVDYATRHVFLDNNNDKAYILGQLRATEKIAKKNGYAVAIGHPKSQTYVALKEWLPTLEEKGIKLVPMSEIVELRN